MRVSSDATDHLVTLDVVANNIAEVLRIDAALLEQGIETACKLRKPIATRDGAQQRGE